MKKIKYQGGLTKLITSKIGNHNKKRFAKFIERNLSSLKRELNDKTIEIDVVSFSCGRDFYDQTLSILSFLKYLGTPLNWSIYSDGSHTLEQISLLESSFEFVKVIRIDWGNPEKLRGECKEILKPFLGQLFDYAANHPLGKRLFIYLNYAIKNPTLFLDSDILFYNNAPVIDLIIKENVNGWYLPELDWGCLDSRYKENHSKELYQVNGGFLFFTRELTRLSEGLEFLKSLKNKYEYFSEQTVMHILLKSNGFMPLDPRIFILDSSDQFDFSYSFTREKMAIRHYTGPVRHKMWQRDWRWQLSIH